MMDVVIRVALVALVLAAAWTAAAVLERHRGRRGGGLSPGVTLVTGPDCRLCEPAERALSEHGVAFETVDLSAVRERIGGVMSLPVALVVGDDGSIRLRRAGRSVITDAAEIAAAVAPRAGPR